MTLITLLIAIFLSSSKVSFSVVYHLLKPCTWCSQYDLGWVRYLDTPHQGVQRGHIVKKYVFILVLWKCYTHIQDILIILIPHALPWTSSKISSSHLPSNFLSSINLHIYFYLLSPVSASHMHLGKGWSTGVWGPTSGHNQRKKATFPRSAIVPQLGLGSWEPLCLPCWNF